VDKSTLGGVLISMGLLDAAPALFVVGPRLSEAARKAVFPAVVAGGAPTTAVGGRPVGRVF
jgi:hypothetical protein